VTAGGAGIRTSQARPYLLLLVTIFFWGTAFRWTDVGADHASPVVFSALRAVPAMLALLALAAVLGSSRPRGRTLVYAALSGPLMVTLAFEGIAEGVTLAGAANAAVLINTTPFFTLLLGRAFLGERLGRPAVGGLLIGFAGVVLMVSSQLGGDRPTGDLLLGMGLALLAGAGFAVGTLLIKAAATREGDAFDVMGFTAVQYVVGGLLLVLLVPLYGDVGETDWASGDLWAAVAWVALGSSAIASLTFALALRSIPATRASAWQFLAPVVAVIVELAFGDAPSPVVLLGMVLAIAGVALVSALPGPAPDPAPVAEPVPIVPRSAHAAES
jgi:drug/metabolite transporter (DMT)-like permease